MPKRKSVLTGTIATIITLFIISPLDDIILISLFSFTFLQFQLGWFESILIGCGVGALVYAIIELIEYFRDGS